MKNTNNTQTTNIVNEESVGSKVKNTIVSIVLDLLLAILVILIIAMIFFRCTYQGFYVVGDSMLPTIVGSSDEYSSGGEYLFVNKTKTPDYGDVVTINASYLGENNSNKGKNIIKRVIAKEGDYIKIEHNRVYIWYAGTEGYVALEEKYLADDVYMANYYHKGPIAEGCIFVLGDNREISNDSRKDFGDVPLENIYGVFDQFGQSIRNVSTAVYTFFTYDINILFKK